MAKLPDKQQLGSRLIPSPSTSLVSVDTSAITQANLGSANTLAQLGGDVFKVGGELIAAENDRDIAEAEFNWEKEKINIENAINDEPDFNNFQPLYAKSAKESTDRVLSGIRNPKVRAKVQARLALDVLSGTQAVRNKTKESYHDFELARVDGNLTEGLKIISETQGADRREALMRSGLSEVQSLVDRGIVSKQGGQKMVEKYTSDFTLARLSTMTPSQQIAQLKTSKNKTTLGDVLDTRTRSILLDKAKKQQKINTAKARSETLRSVNSEIKAVQTAISAGIESNPDQIKILNAKIKTLGGDGDASQSVLNSILNTEKVVVDFSTTASIVESRGKLERMEAEISSGGATEQNVNDFLAAKNKMAQKEALFTQDPRSYYESVGVIDPSRSINMSDVDPLLVEQRIADQALIRGVDGVNIPVLTKGETLSMINTYETGTSEQISNLLQNIGDNFPPEQRRLMALDVSKEKGHILAAAMATEGDVSEGIIEGSKLDNIVKSSEIKNAINDKLLDININNAETFQGGSDAVGAYYKALSLRDADTSETLNNDRFDEAFSGVFGESLNVSPSGYARVSKVLGFKDANGVALGENDVEDVLSRIDFPLLSRLNKDQLPQLENGNISEDDFKRVVTFVTAGDGIVLARIEGRGDLFNKDGTPYTINLKAARALQQSDPETISRQLNTRRGSADPLFPR